MLPLKLFTLKKEQQNQRHGDKKPRAVFRSRRQFALVDIKGVIRGNSRSKAGKEGWTQSAGKLDATLRRLGFSFFL